MHILYSAVALLGFGQGNSLLEIRQPENPDSTSEISDTNDTGDLNPELSEGKDEESISADESPAIPEPSSTSRGPLSISRSNPQQQLSQSASLSEFENGATPKYTRKGTDTAMLLGISNCWQIYCQYPGSDGGKLGVGPVFGMDFGVRPIPELDIAGGFSLSYLPVSGADSGKYANGWYSLHMGARYYPIKQDRWDPYVGAGLGFNQFWGWSSVDDYDVVNSFSRANFRLSGGLDVFVLPGFSVGLGLTYNYAIGGKGCVWVEDEDKYCESLSELEGDDVDFSSDGATIQSNRGIFPRPLETSLVLRWHT